MSLEIKDINILGQDIDGCYNVTDGNFIYKVSKGCNIKVKSGIYAYILDVTNNENINVDIDGDSTLKYIVMSSQSTNRKFKNSGELIYIEISLDKTNEDICVDLVNENASFNGKTLSLAKSIESNYTQRVNHLARMTESNISNYGIALEKGQLMFDTTGFIERGMSKSKCAQLAHGVVMDEESVVKSKPILLINEYDCLANHGAAIGKMSDETLFYLMSRGLTRNEAFLLVLQGIVKPFLDEIPQDSLKEETNKRFNDLINKEQ